MTDTPQQPVSVMEIVITGHAYRAGLVRGDTPTEAAAWSLVASAFPVAVFLLSIPIAFANTTVAILSWFALAPVGFLINTRMPPAVSEYFGRY